MGNETQRSSRIWAFGFFTVPTGVAQGFTTVVLPFIAARNHMPLAAIGLIVGVGTLAHPMKLIWTPLIDLCLSFRFWVVAGCLTTGVATAMLLAMPLTAEHAVALAVIAFVANAASTLTSTAGGGLVATIVDRGRLARASGIWQGSALVAQGLGGGGGVWLATHEGVDMAGAIALLACLPSMASVFLLPEPEKQVGGATIGGRLLAIGEDLWAVARSRRGVFVMASFCAPIGVGGASYLFSGIAAEWHAGADVVAIATGFGAACATAAGSVLYGWVAEGVDRFESFLATAVLLIAAAVLLALSPRTPIWFVGATLGYSLCLGCAYTSFTALLFDVVEGGAAASKFCALNALGNIPNAYMPPLLGLVHDSWSSGVMLGFEAVFTSLVVIAFALLRGVGGWEPVRTMAMAEA